ncbi:MAG TPA: hypothetical protein VGC94_00265, partial [Amnibacterium sp.]
MSAPHVDRTRLTDLIGEGLTVIAAPPGWGRTTVLHQVAERTGGLLQDHSPGSEPDDDTGLLLIDDTDGAAIARQVDRRRPGGLVLVTAAQSSARLRADRVIDRADLAFTTAEIAELLRSAGRDDRYRLAARIRAETWGWPALVVAAVAALERRMPLDESDPDALALGPTRDRFARAAMRELDEEDEADLRMLAVLPGWSAGGTRAVLGHRSVATIARLEQAGLLVVHGPPRRVAVLRPIRDALRAAGPGSADLEAVLQRVGLADPEFAALRALAGDWTGVGHALERDFRAALEGPREWALSLPGRGGAFRRARAAAYADLGRAESVHRGDEAEGGPRPPSAPARLADSFDLAPHLVRAIGVLMCGDVRRALRLLGAPAADQRTATVAELLIAALRAASGSDGERRRRLEAVAARAEAGGLDRVARIALGAAAATGAEPHERRLFREIVDDCERCGDEVAVALLEAFDLLRRSFAGTPARREATELLSRIEPYGSPTATAWIAALLALASIGDADAPVLLERAERSAAVARSPGPIALALGARAILEGDEPRLRARARECALEAGMLRLPFPDRWRPARPALLPWAGVGAGPSVRIRCFGRFAVSLDGTELDLGRMRPQARLVLRILAASSEHPVHRDLLLELLSAEDREPASLHALHVHLSSIR